MELALPSTTIQARLKECAARTKAASPPVAATKVTEPEPQR